MGAVLASLPLVAEGGIAYVFLIAAILVLTVTLMRRLYRYRTRQKRQASSRPSHRSADEGDPRGLRVGAPDSIVRWEVEMQELGRDLKAEIDSKMVALENLIRDADRAANRLEAATKSALAAEKDIPREESAPGSVPAVHDNAAIQEEVYTLRDYGFSTGDIASRLGAPVEQVELILRQRESRK